MRIKEFIQQLQKLDENQEIYVPNTLDLKEPIIQEMSFKDDNYFLIVS